MKLPEDFIAQLSEKLSKNELEEFTSSLENPAPISIRKNPNRIIEFQDLETVPWNKEGFYLTSRPSFVADPHWHAGDYYVQEASSMIVGELIRQLRGQFSSNIRVLDLCGAPGGKSTDIVSKLQQDDLLVSNEVIRSRANILYENVTKWGYPNHLVTQNDPLDFAALEGFFDILVIDAPCSGEGLFRKDIQSRSEWSLQNVSLCAERQERIISDAWDCLTENGVMIYSTCTYNTAENHGIIKWLEDNFYVENVRVAVNDDWGFKKEEVSGITLHQAMPHRVKGEGFSFFVIRKTGTQKELKIKTKVNVEKNHPKWINADAHGDFIEDGGDIFFQTKPEQAFIIQKFLNVIKKGVKVASIKKNKWIPSHELAYSRILDSDIFPRIDLSYELAINYLRNETFDLASQKGNHIMTFEGSNLGFINHLGNRFNNLYPQSWRIRTREKLQKPNFS